MAQIVEGQLKEISDRQIEAIKQIIQSRDFNLSEYKKLKKILDSRVITRRDASVFLGCCYAKVGFERYFNGHHHKAYAACCYCKGRDNLGKIENLKTGDRNWCCQTCRSSITDDSIVDMPRVRDRQEGSAGQIDDGYVIARVNRHEAGATVSQIDASGTGK